LRWWGRTLWQDHARGDGSPAAPAEQRPITWNGRPLRRMGPLPGAACTSPWSGQDYHKWRRSARPPTSPWGDIDRPADAAADRDRRGAGGRPRHDRRTETRLRNPAGQDVPQRQDLSGGQVQRITAAPAASTATHTPADHGRAVVGAGPRSPRTRSSRRYATDQGRQTTILITHRLANITHADRIIVLDPRRGDGDSGTHAELMATPRQNTRRLFTLQASGYQSHNDERS